MAKYFRLLQYSRVEKLILENIKQDNWFIYLSNREHFKFVLRQYMYDLAKTSKSLESLQEEDFRELALEFWNLRKVEAIGGINFSDMLDDVANYIKTYLPSCIELAKAQKAKE